MQAYVSVCCGRRIRFIALRCNIIASALHNISAVGGGIVRLPAGVFQPDANFISNSRHSDAIRHLIVAVCRRFIERWRGRIVNIHPSLLPAYRGLDTHARSLAAGETVSGCTVHVVTEELDAGEIIAASQVPIEPGDTPATLEQRVLAAEHLLYPRALAKFVAR